MEMKRPDALQLASTVMTMYNVVVLTVVITFLKVIVFIRFAIHKLNLRGDAKLFYGNQQINQ